MVASVIASGALLALLAASLGAQTPTAPPDSVRVARLDSQFATDKERLRLPGLAVAVVRGGQVIWSKGYGFADLEQRIPVTPNTPFNIASLTKPMTSALVMQLVERGQLSLDEPMAQYAPDVGRPGATVRHVLSMTAESDPPGTAYSYNGNVYSALGRVLETKTGLSFAELLVGRVVEPLQMARTVPGLDILDSTARARNALGTVRLTRYSAVAADLALPYRVFGGNEIVAALPPPAELNAAANVISTVLDYARFVTALAGSGLVADSTRARLWSPNIRPDGTRLPYSLGWFVQDYERQRVVWQHGYWPDGYSGLILIVPDARLALVAMANADGLSAPFYWTEGVEGNLLACQFLRAFVREDLPCAAVAEAAVARWEAKLTPSPYRTVPVSPSLLDRYTGSYITPSGRRIGIVSRNGELWWGPARGGLFQLFPLAENRFFLKAADYVLTFVSGPSGAIVRIDLAIGGRTLTLTRAPAAP